MSSRSAISLRLLPSRPSRNKQSGPAWGDADAFAQLYARHHQALYRYCRSILGNEDDARDALQSTMERAFAALQQEQRDFELRPWLFRIAHNEAISLIRRRRATQPLESLSDLGHDVLGQQLASRQELRQLREDLAQLGGRQRSALVLRELSGLSHAEIASVLQSTPGAVKQTIFEARSALQEHRTGRAMPCEDVRRIISDADGRSLRGRAIKAHLRDCAACRDFQRAMRERPEQLALLAPVLPAAVGASLLQHLVGPAKAAGLSGAASSSVGGLTSALTAKVVVATIAVAGTGAGIVTAVHTRHHRSPAGVVHIHGASGGPAPRSLAAPLRTLLGASAAARIVPAPSRGTHSSPPASSHAVRPATGNRANPVHQHKPVHGSAAPSHAHSPNSARRPASSPVGSRPQKAHHTQTFTPAKQGAPAHPSHPVRHSGRSSAPSVAVPPHVKKTVP